VTVSPALRSALGDDCSSVSRRLPSDVALLLERLGAPPRLAAHLRIVHDVAGQLLDELALRYPELAVDQDAVRFGAATHDIGKVRHPEELGGPGSAHEAVGHELLVAEGFPERLARFARTHGDWSASDRTVEDHLVSVADTVWKGKRVAGLEDLVLGRLAEATGAQRWQAFVDLDEILERLAGPADERLAFQASYPISGGLSRPA
jgi:putative nucleotidyltransferase with HDIG domain